MNVIHVSDTMSSGCAKHGVEQAAGFSVRFYVYFISKKISWFMIAKKLNNF